MGAWAEVGAQDGDRGTNLTGAESYVEVRICLEEMELGLPPDGGSEVAGWRAADLVPAPVETVFAPPVGRR